MNSSEFKGALDSLRRLLIYAALAIALAFVAYWLVSWIIAAAVILLLAVVIGHFLFGKRR